MFVYVEGFFFVFKYCLLELFFVVGVGGLGVEAESVEFLFDLVDAVVGVDLFEFVVEVGEELVPAGSAFDLFGVGVFDVVEEWLHVVVCGAGGCVHLRSASSLSAVVQRMHLFGVSQMSSVVCSHPLISAANK